MICIFHVIPPVFFLIPYPYDKKFPTDCFFFVNISLISSYRISEKKKKHNDKNLSHKIKLKKLT